MKRGDKITVIDASGNRLDRIVVAVDTPTVYVCLPLEYERAIRQREEPDAIGFKIWDVVDEVA